MSHLVSIHLEMVLVFVQDRCMVCTKHTIGPEPVLDAPMVLLGDEAQVEIHSQSVWTCPMELLRYVGHVESCSIYLEMMLVSVR